METTKYLRAKEVSKYIGISISTVWNYAKQGLLTPKKISSRVTVFELKEIDNLLESITLPATNNKVA